MTQVEITEASRAVDRPVAYIEWSAVLAGAVMAAALSIVLLTFGSAIGLSLTSPWQGSGLSASTTATLAAFWVILLQIGAALAGGYIAGRMRPRWTASELSESEFRDGLHGGLVWALSVILSAYLVSSAVGAISRTGATLAGQAATAISGAAEPLASQIDALLRPATSTAASPSTAAPNATAQQPAGVSTEQRAELARIFVRSMTAGSLNANDRSYVSGLIAQRTGMSQQEAERRIDTVYAEAVTATKQAADTARRSAVLAGLVTAASLLVSLAAAWWAAVRGGDHRDNAIPAHFATIMRS